MASSHDDVTPPGARGVERRSILKAAAWAVPTIVVATASPAAAHGSGTMVAVRATGTLYDLGVRVRFIVTFRGTSPGTHTVTFTRVHVPGALTVNINTTKTLGETGGLVLFDILAVGALRGKTATISYTVSGHGSGTIAAPIGG